MKFFTTRFDLIQNVLFYFYNRALNYKKHQVFQFIHNLVLTLNKFSSKSDNFQDIFMYYHFFFKFETNLVRCTAKMENGKSLQCELLNTSLVVISEIENR